MLNTAVGYRRVHAVTAVSLQSCCQQSKHIYSIICISTFCEHAMVVMLYTLYTLCSRIFMCTLALSVFVPLTTAFSVLLSCIVVSSNPYLDPVYSTRWGLCKISKYHMGFFKFDTNILPPHTCVYVCIYLARLHHRQRDSGKSAAGFDLSGVIASEADFSKGDFTEVVMSKAYARVSLF